MPRATRRQPAKKPRARSRKTRKGKLNVDVNIPMLGSARISHSKGVSAPAAKGLVTKSSPFSRSSTSDGERVAGRITIIQVTDLPLTEYRINPGLALFGRLSQIAATYDRYQFNRLRFHYVNTVGSDTSGFITMFGDPNVTNTLPFDLMDVSSYANAKGPAWSSFDFDMPRQSAPLFTRTTAVPEGQDPKTYDCFLFALYVTNASRSDLGYIDVEFDVTFANRKPNLQSQCEMTSDELDAADPQWALALLNTPPLLGPPTYQLAITQPATVDHDMAFMGLPVGLWCLIFIASPASSAENENDLITVSAPGSNTVVSQMLPGVTANPTSPCFGTGPDVSPVKAMAMVSITSPAAAFVSDPTWNVNDLLRNNPGWISVDSKAPGTASVPLYCSFMLCYMGAPTASTFAGAPSLRVHRSRVSDNSRRYSRALTSRPASSRASAASSSSQEPYPQVYKWPEKE